MNNILYDDDDDDDDDDGLVVLRSSDPYYVYHTLVASYLSTCCSRKIHKNTTRIKSLNVRARLVSNTSIGMSYAGGILFSIITIEGVHISVCTIKCNNWFLSNSILQFIRNLRNYTLRGNTHHDECCV